MPAPVVPHGLRDAIATRVPAVAADIVAAPPTVPTSLAGSRAGYLGVLTLAVATVVLLGALAAQMKGSASRRVPILLKDRRQVTTLGTILSPALSSDGAYLAYVTRQCAPAGCTFGIDHPGGGNPRDPQHRPWCVVDRVCRLESRPAQSHGGRDTGQWKGRPVPRVGARRHAARGELGSTSRPSSPGAIPCCSRRAPAPTAPTGCEWPDSTASLATASRSRAPLSVSSSR